MTREYDGYFAPEAHADSGWRERLSGGMTDKCIAIVPDEDYVTRGSYALDTEQETREAEDEELAKLQSGESAAYGVIVYTPCDHADHGHECPHAKTIEDVWGTVADAGHDGDYGKPDEIRDPFLRQTAEDMWGEYV